MTNANDVDMNNRCGEPTKKGEPCLQLTGGKPCRFHESEDEDMSVMELIRGIRLWREVQEDDDYPEANEVESKKPDSEVAKKIIDPSKVSTKARRACLPTLKWDNGLTQEECASLFDVSPSQISYDMNAIRDDKAEFVENVERNELASLLFERGRRIVDQLQKDGSHKEAWEVLSDMREELHELGLIEKVPDTYEHQTELAEEDKEILNNFSEYLQE